jgi:hypothetical protein
VAGNKYISNNAGTLTEVAANQTSAGAGDAGKIVALDATGKLDQTMMPVGIAADVAVITASEALSAGDFVNVWNSTGAKARKADASTSGKEAVGFVLSAVSNGAAATVYFEGTNTGVTGLTPGLNFLSTTPGAATATAPSTAGQVVQRIGYATAATALNFEPQEPIVLA